MHVYWAGGGWMGTPPDAGAISERPWFLIYDLASAAVLAVAAGIALLLSSEAVSDTWRRRLTTLTSIGTVLALLRGFGGLGQDAIILAGR